MSLIWWKTVRTELAMCCAHPHSLSSCSRLAECRRSDSPRSVLSQQHHSGLCDLDKGDNYPHFEKASTNILCAGATGIKHRQPPGCPTCPFTLQHFKLLQAELPETVVNSWHWEFPWSQLACKKGCLFTPENNVLPRHCPNTSNEKKKKTCFEQPLKKLSPVRQVPRI